MSISSRHSPLASIPAPHIAQAENANPVKAQGTAMRRTIAAMQIAAYNHSEAADVIRTKNVNSPASGLLALDNTMQLPSAVDRSSARTGTSLFETQANQPGNSPARDIPSGTSPWNSTHPLRDPMAETTANTAVSSAGR